MRVRSTIDKTGPFFAHDPGETFEQNAKRMFEAIAEAAEREAIAVASPYRRTGAFVAGIRGRTVRLDGTPFKHPRAVVSQTHIYPWKGGAPKQYRGGRLEASHHMFRLTKSRVNAVSERNEAELLKGIA